MLKGTPSQILSALGPGSGHTSSVSDAARLAETFQLFDAILEGVDGGFWRFHCLEKKLQWSEGLYKMFDLDPALGIDSERFEALILPEERDEVRRHLYEFILNGGHFKDEFRMLQKDGTIVHIQSVGNCIEYGSDGRPLILAGFTTGVTDTKGTEALKSLNQQLQKKISELELADLRMSVALKGEPLCLYMQNEELEFVWAYKIADRFGGMAALGKTDRDLGFPHAQAEAVVALKRKAIDTQTTQQNEGWIKDIHGQDAYVSVKFVPYTLPDGTLGLVGKVFDLTLHKAREEQNIRYAEDLKVLTESLQKEKQDLTEALAKLSKENKRKSEDLAEARQLQTSLLPTGQIQFKNFSVATHMATSVEVGGDYYDFYRKDDDSMVVALGDATGHGLRAGIIVAMVKSYFQLLAPLLQPYELLERISANLEGMRLQKMYMGLLVMHYDGTEFALASAGMPPVLIYRHGSGEVESIVQPNIFLGTHIPIRKEMIRFQLAPGDVLVAMSDGLPEAINLRGEMISLAMIQSTLAHFGSLGPQATINALVSLQARWTGTADLKDDTTLVALRME